MEYNIPKGVYDQRVQGLYNGHVVFFDMQVGYLIGNPHARKPTPKELIEIEKKFGDLEKNILEVK